MMSCDFTIPQHHTTGLRQSLVQMEGHSQSESRRRNLLTPLRRLAPTLVALVTTSPQIPAAAAAAAATVLADLAVAAVMVVAAVATMMGKIAVVYFLFFFKIYIYHFVFYGSKRPAFWHSPKVSNLLLLICDTGVHAYMNACMH